jgi:hypothetical protein
MGAPPVVEVEKHDDLRALLTANDPPPSEAVTSRTWSGLYRARAAAGLIPRLTTVLGTASLGSTALAVGWKIGRTLDTKWLHFSYQEPAPDPSLLNPQAWQWDRWPTPLYCSNGGPCVGTDQWVLDVGGGNVWVMQDRGRRTRVIRSTGSAATRSSPTWRPIRRLERPSRGTTRPHPGRGRASRATRAASS